MLNIYVTLNTSWQQDWLDLYVGKACLFGNVQHVTMCVVARCVIIYGARVSRAMSYSVLYN